MFVENNKSFVVIDKLFVTNDLSITTIKHKEKEPGLISILIRALLY